MPRRRFRSSTAYSSGSRRGSRAGNGMFGRVMAAYESVRRDGESTESSGHVFEKFMRSAVERKNSEKP